LAISFALLLATETNSEPWSDKRHSLEHSFAHRFDIRPVALFEAGVAMATLARAA
jgi:hypothetical protein